VLRVSGDNAAHLGINRRTEYEALTAASRAGIAPHVVLFTQPEGCLITRFVEGHAWTSEEFKAPDVIRRVAVTMRKVHALPAIRGTFSPYRDIERRLAIAQGRGIAPPAGLDALLDKLGRIERERAALASPVLCHNDPFHNNFLVGTEDGGRVYLLDWEFAGMGDRFFDLASVSYFFAPDEKTYLLERYFGEVTDAHRRALDQLWYVVAFWNATWALVQIGNPHADFDYAGMATNVFARMAETV
jgi:thiamine kinase-like enzyme